MLCWEILTRAFPFPELDMLSQIAEMTVQGKRETIPIYCPLPFREVIEKCWAQLPEERPKWDWVLPTLEATLALKPDEALSVYLEHEEKTIKDKLTNDLNPIPSVSPQRSPQKSAPKKAKETKERKKKGDIPDGFEKMFKDKALFSSFEQHLENIYADNLHFYSDVQNFKQKEFKSKDDCDSTCVYTTLSPNSWM